MRLTLYVCTSTQTYVYIYTHTIDYIYIYIYSFNNYKKNICQLPLEAASAFGCAAAPVGYISDIYIYICHWCMSMYIYIYMYMYGICIRFSGALESKLQAGYRMLTYADVCSDVCWRSQVLWSRSCRIWVLMPLATVSPSH